MKKLAFIMTVALVMLFGCSKDILTDETLELKSANVPIPMKGEVCMIDNEDDRIPVHFWSPDGDIVPDATVVRTTFLYGTLTHMGKLDEQTYMTGREGAYLDYDAFLQGKTIIVATYDARLFAANGDYVDLISNIRMDTDNQTLTGDWEIIGGSGRFKNAAGNGLLSGELYCWDIEGTLEFPRD